MSPSSATTSAGSTNSAAPRFSLRCAMLDVPGMSRMLGARASNHASATCNDEAPSRAAMPESAVGLNWVETAKWEERHIGDLLFAQRVDERVIASLHQIVLVLHTDHRRNALCLGDLGGGDVAQTLDAGSDLGAEVRPERRTAQRSILRSGFASRGRRCADRPRPSHRRRDCGDYRARRASVSAGLCAGTHDASSPRNAPTLVTMVKPSG